MGRNGVPVSDKSLVVFCFHLLGCLLCRVGLEEDKKGMRELRRDFKGRDRGGESSF